MTSNFIWQDSMDCDMYHIGMKRMVRYIDGKSQPVENEYIILASLHVDRVSDLFGQDDWKQVERRVRQQPREVHLGLSLPIDMDYPVVEQADTTEFYASQELAGENHED